MSSASSSTLSMLSASPPTASSNVAPNHDRNNSNAAIAAPSFPSAAFPASAIAPALGRISAASATRPSTPPPVPTCVSLSPTAPAVPPKSSLSTMIAASARTVSRSSRTASVPTASAVTASWPTPSVSSCTPPPTTWSICSVCSCLSPGARPRSKPCALVCSNTARASARPRAAFTFIWPPAGPGRTCFNPLCTPSTPAKPQPSVCQSLSSSRHCGAVPNSLCPLPLGYHCRAKTTSTAFSLFRPYHIMPRIGLTLSTDELSRLEHCIFLSLTNRSHSL